MPTVANVTVGKPKVAGAIWRAPLGSTLPTDADSALDAAFKDLGFVSQDGVSNGSNLDTSVVKAWGGKAVLLINNGKEDTFAFTLIETINSDAKKAVYGTSNVTGDLDSGMTTKVNSDDPEEACWVIEVRQRGGVLHRIVIPDAQLSDLGDIVYKDDEVVGYEMTITALEDSAGQTHYEYDKKS